MKCIVLRLCKVAHTATEQANQLALWFQAKYLNGQRSDQHVISLSGYTLHGSSGKRSPQRDVQIFVTEPPTGFLEY